MICFSTWPLAEYTQPAVNPNACVRAKTRGQGASGRKSARKSVEPTWPNGPFTPGGCGWNQMAADDLKRATGVLGAAAALGPEPSAFTGLGGDGEHAEIPSASSTDKPATARLRRLAGATG